MRKDRISDEIGILNIYHSVYDNRCIYTGKRYIVDDYMEITATDGKCIFVIDAYNKCFVFRNKKYTNIYSDKCDDVINNVRYNYTL